jgi:hypothetical protein
MGESVAKVHVSAAAAATSARSGATRARVPLLASCVLACLAVTASVAAAAVTHEFVPGLTTALQRGVAKGEAPIFGELSEVGALTVDSGHLWIAERINGGAFLGDSRVDAFDLSDGAFLPPQLDEESGVNELGHGVAVGHALGKERVYVSAGVEGIGVVAVFDPVTGKLVAVWRGATTFNPHGTLTGVAVDNSGNPSTSGDVYLAAQSFDPSFPAANVVDVFAPVASGEEPPVLAQLSGTCPVAGTTCPGEEVPFGDPTGVAVSAANGDVLVIDKHKVVDVFEPVGVGEYRFLRQLTGTPTGPSEAEVEFEEVPAVAVDGGSGAGSGDTYVIDGRHAVDQFNAAGEYVGRLRGTPTGPSGALEPFEAVQSVAVDAADHSVFVADLEPEKQADVVDVFGGDVVVPDVTTSAASGVAVKGSGALEATLHGTVNPREAGEASCRFAWGTSRALGSFAACEPEEVADGGAPVGVKATLTGLRPDTTYFYRLQASNENGTNPGEPGQDQAFTTPGPGLDDASVTDVASTSATLDASINPHGVTTSYYFEYGRGSAYEAQTPLAPGSLVGSGEGDVALARHVQGLAPSTTYHYRVVGVSQLEIEPGVVQAASFAGPDQTFTTQAGTGVGRLPDSRRWELVSPADKHGGSIGGIGGAAILQAAAPGGAMTYLSTVPTEASVPGFSGGVQVMSSRGAGGWSSQDLALPHNSAAGTSGTLEFPFFSEDLSRALAEPSGQFTSLAPYVSPPDTERTPYIRHDATCATAPGACFEPLLTAAAGFSDVPAGTEFGGAAHTTGAPFVDATPDLAHVVLSATVNLTSVGAGGHEELYEWSAGAASSERLRLLSALPHGAGVATFARIGYEGAATRHAISDDGSRVVWSEQEGQRHLYMRINATRPQSPLDGAGECTVAADACTIQLDVAQPNAPASGEVAPEFQLASSDGTRVLFTDHRKLTEDSGALPGLLDLYECQIVVVAGSWHCKLSDLTPLRSGENAAVQGGALGASRDASYVYFVADGVLGDGGERGAGRGDCSASNFTAQKSCNLYLLHYDSASGKWEAPRFITALSGEDHPDWTLNPTGSGQTARVSPDGRWLAFMSERSLAGYDNRDAHSGQLDQEVFLYHANAGGGVVCASCDPTGARPVGVEYDKLRLVAGTNIWEPQVWLAANIPAWTPYELLRSRYQSRYLSDSGRLFFNSGDALVPQDINNNEDVYQFEPLGVGDCASASATFDAAKGGCVALISSGVAHGESAFLDASETGDDVFFLTAEQLTPQDIDNAVDVYDAHACSAAAPCSSVPAFPPACTTVDACRAAPAPQPSIFGPPASATFAGPGNAVPPAPAPTRPLTAHERLLRALRACHRDRNRHRRHACERRAKRRYGRAPAHKAPAAASGRGA